MVGALGTGGLRRAARDLVEDCGACAGASSSAGCRECEWKHERAQGRGRTFGVGDLRVVGALDLGRDADERPAEGVLGRRVEHLGLDLGLVGRPVALSSASMSA